MEIIKEGNKTMTFNCPTCECIFKAEKNEYHAISGFSGKIFNAKCPCCGQEIYIKPKN